MGVVALPRSRLPDAFIGLVPVFRDVFSKPDQDFLRAAVKSSVELPILRAGVDDLAVDIQLKLLPGAIANAHRRRVPIAAQVPKLVLVRSELSENRIQDPELRLGQARRVQQPGKKALGFISI